MLSITRSHLPAVMFLMAAGALAIALVSQHVFGYSPCPWCIFQRVLYLGSALASLLAWCLRGHATASRSLVGLATLSGIGAFAAAAYQHFVSAPSGSCALTWPDRQISQYGLDDLAPWFFQVTAACDEADRAIAGLPYSVWSMILAAVLVAMGVCHLVSRQPVHRDGRSRIASGQAGSRQDGRR